jgi:glutamate-1-semialdehyde 2,1-aminomutase
MNTTRSKQLFDEAQTLMPGGVNSPVRAFRSVGGEPIYIDHANGSRMWDVDGNVYIDYVGSWGPMIVGHAHARVTEAIKRAAEKGTSFGTSSEGEIEMARLVQDRVPSLEMVRMVNSGTEATMSAMRLARAFTGRNKIVKFEGCYHGHGDSFLSKAGSGVATFGLPDSPGVTPTTAADTLNAIYNDLASVENLIAENREQIAAVFIEPVAGNMGCVAPREGFLEDLRELCTRENILLVFDEVMCGFRVARGGAQELYGVTPDLTTFGKIIGGGLPVGAFGGRREIMEMIAPSGPVYQAGTLSGNPLAMAAGIATLQVIDDEPDFYLKLANTSARLVNGLRDAAAEAGVPVTVNHVGSMFTLFFTDREVTDFTSAKTSDTAKFARYFRAMLGQGIYLAPSQFEACFVSAAHTDEDVDRTIEAARAALAGIG